MVRRRPLRPGAAPAAAIKRRQPARSLSFFHPKSLPTNPSALRNCSLRASSAPAHSVCPRRAVNNYSERRGINFAGNDCKITERMPFRDSFALVRFVLQELVMVKLGEGPCPFPLTDREQMQFDSKRFPLVFRPFIPFDEVVVQYRVVRLHCISTDLANGKTFADVTGEDVASLFSEGRAKSPKQFIILGSHLFAPFIRP
ncbi:MAG TPA: hypothetical protein VKU82_01775 [Planctomycetaceae bacterium]|nr:hypothetical protein [Planctomycetaceae bacterium]